MYTHIEREREIQCVYIYIERERDIHVYINTSSALRPSRPYGIRSRVV